MSDQRPVELILARGLMSNITTPAFLVDALGALVFFNDAAGQLLGVRYEETGSSGLDHWDSRFEPLAADGTPVSFDELPLAIALREARPVHQAIRIRSLLGDERMIEVSAFPIVGNAGLRGAMAIFWDASTGA